VLLEKIKEHEGEDMKILIVDDETLVRIGIKSCIQSYYDSYEIHEAVDGNQALMIIKEMKPELVITDIKMPAMDGLQLIENTNKLGLNIKFIVLSCFDEYEYVRQAMKMGAKDYILKHKMDPENIYSLIENVKMELEALSGPGAPAEIQNKDSIDILKQEFIKSLIRGNLHSQDFINKKIRDYHMRLHGKLFVLCILGIDDYRKVKERYSERDDHLLTYSVCNIVDELLGNIGNGEIAYYSQNQFIILLSFDTAEQKEIFQCVVNTVREIQGTLQQYLEISTSYSIVSMARPIRELNKCYEKAQKVDEYNFFKGNQSITFDYEIIQFKEKGNISELPDPDSFYSQLIILDKDNIKSAIQQVIENAAKVYQPEPVKLKKFFLGFLDKVIKRLLEHTDVINNKIEFYNDLNFRISQAESLQDLNECITNIISSVRKSLYERKVRINSPIVLKVIKLMENRYYENISLEQVAEELKVNPSYLSRVFKKEMTENFIDFLTTVRIKKAKELLKTTELSVHEIAVDVGYINQQYFSKVFKKSTNLTPSEYKLKYLNGNAGDERDA
jgi:two-component system, response regulator YesN